MAAKVSVTIVGRTYEISCDEGQEDYVLALAGDIDRRANELFRSVGQVGDARLMVMVALLMADEIAELRRQPPPSPIDDDETDLALSSGLDALARRIEAVANRLEASA